MDVLLATCARFAALIDDDRLLVRALAARGMKASPAVWDDSSVDWAAARMVLVRSVWDYHLRVDEFLAWVARIAAVTRIQNPAQMIRWNAHKSYLRELARAGVAVVETEWRARGSRPDLGAVCEARGWETILLKPAVGASAYGTRWFTRSDLGAAEAHAAGLLRSGDLMVQPFLEEVEERGERSFIFIDGELTHAVQRASALRARLGESEAVVPGRRDTALARAALSVVSRPPLYARADLVETRAHGWLLSELELIEPNLFLGHSPAAIETFADAVARRAG